MRESYRQSNLTNRLVYTADVTSSAKPDLGILLAVAYEQFVSDLHAHLARQGFSGLGRSDGSSCGPWPAGR